MDEKTQEETTGKGTQSSETQTTPQGTNDTQNRNPSETETTTLIDDANLAAKRLEDANKEKSTLLDREENLAAKRALGGTTEAGQAPKVETEDEKWAKDANSAESVSITSTHNNCVFVF